MNIANRITNMIDSKLMRAKRLELGMTQSDVAEKTKILFGVGSQQGYRKLESGEAEHSKYLAYYCQALGLVLSEVDSSISDNLAAAADDIFNQAAKLPQEEQLAVVQKILANLQN